MKGRSTTYFDLNGMWHALNVEKDIPRNEISLSYTHIAFLIEEAEFDKMYEKLKELNINILSGRPRDEEDKKFIYFTDPDGHKFEFHTGTLQDRLDYYKQEKNIWNFLIKDFLLSLMDARVENRYLWLKVNNYKYANVFVNGYQKGKCAPGTFQKNESTNRKSIIYTRLYCWN